MIEKEALYRALRQMGKEQLKAQYKDDWTPERPTTGYCYVVAEVLYRYGMVPKGSKPYCVRLADDDTHWFIRDPNGKVIDFTGDQFDAPIDYDMGKPRQFRTKDLSKRAKILAELLGLPKLADES